MKDRRFYIVIRFIYRYIKQPYSETPTNSNIQINSKYTTVSHLGTINSAPNSAAAQQCIKKFTEFMLCNI